MNNQRFGFGLCLVALLGLGSSQNEPTDLDDLTVNFRIAPGCEKKLYRRDPKTTTLSIEEQNQCQAIFDCGSRCQGAESQCNEQTLPICNTYRRRECKTTYEKVCFPNRQSRPKRSLSRQKRTFGRSFRGRKKSLRRNFGRRHHRLSHRRSYHSSAHKYVRPRRKTFVSHVHNSPSSSSFSGSSHTVWRPSGSSTTWTKPGQTISKPAWSSSSRPIHTVWKPSPPSTIWKPAHSNSGSKWTTSSNSNHGTWSSSASSQTRPTSHHSWKPKPPTSHSSTNWKPSHSPNRPPHGSTTTIWKPSHSPSRPAHGSTTTIWKPSHSSKYPSHGSSSSIWKPSHAQSQLSHGSTPTISRPNRPQKKPSWKPPQSSPIIWKPAHGTSPTVVKPVQTIPTQGTSSTVWKPPTSSWSSPGIIQKPQPPPSGSSTTSDSIPTQFGTSPEGGSFKPNKPIWTPQPPITSKPVWKPAPPTTFKPTTKPTTPSTTTTTTIIAPTTTTSPASVEQSDEENTTNLEDEIPEGAFQTPSADPGQTCYKRPRRKCSWVPYKESCNYGEVTTCASRPVGCRYRCNKAYLCANCGSNTDLKPEVTSRPTQTTTRRPTTSTTRRTTRRTTYRPTRPTTTRRPFTRPTNRPVGPPKPNRPNGRPDNRPRPPAPPPPGFEILPPAIYENDASDLVTPLRPPVQPKK